ncbi:hypothetical protein [Enterococcus cecorum]|uniref:hypothetical protein n=1 Tax=Enterococcus cecorum TaxID=44008 RepID=UPI00148C1B06|nr:hypothetical protein [Enterococcus cecorum]
MEIEKELKRIYNEVMQMDMLELKRAYEEAETEEELELYRDLFTFRLWQRQKKVISRKEFVR